MRIGTKKTLCPSVHPSHRNPISSLSLEILQPNLVSLTRYSTTKSRLSLALFPMRSRRLSSSSEYIANKKLKLAEVTRAGASRKQSFAFCPHLSVNATEADEVIIAGATHQASDGTYLGGYASSLGSSATSSAIFPHSETTARQYVVGDTTFEGDTSGGDDPTTSVDSVPVTRGTATSTISVADPTLAVTKPPYARGVRSWLRVVPMRFTLLAVLVLWLSSADHSCTCHISLASWVLDRSATYAREYLHWHVRHHVHSKLDPILSWFSPQVIMLLPTEYIPPQQISRLPINHISFLPVKYIAEQPTEIIAQLAPEIIARLPTSVIAELPVSSIRRIHLSPIRWISVGFHSWQKLLLGVSQFTVSLLPTWVPALFTSWTFRFSLNAASLVVCEFIIEQVVMYIVVLLRRLCRHLGRYGRQPCGGRQE